MAKPTNEWCLTSVSYKLTGTVAYTRGTTNASVVTKRVTNGWLKIEEIKMECN